MHKTGPEILPWEKKKRTQENSTALLQIMLPPAMLFYLKSKNRKEGKEPSLSVLRRRETYDSPKTQGLQFTPLPKNTDCAGTP